LGDSKGCTSLLSFVSASMLPYQDRSSHGGPLAFPSLPNVLFS